MNTSLQHLGWAITRFTSGALLAFLHGYGKVFGGNLDGFAQGVARLGFPAPTFFAWCAALAEFVGGILVALGLATRPAAAFAGFTMLVASYRHLDDPWRSRELALVYLAVMLGAMLIGGGRYSLDSVFRLRMPFTTRSGATN
jgi:putative oxidoreductase